MHHSTRSAHYADILRTGVPLELPVATVGEALSLYAAHNNYKAWLSRRSSNPRLLEDDRATALALLTEAGQLLFELHNGSPPAESPASPFHSTPNSISWYSLRGVDPLTPLPKGAHIRILPFGVSPIAPMPHVLPPTAIPEPESKEPEDYLAKWR